MGLPTPPVFRSRFTSLPVSASATNATTSNTLTAVPQMTPPISQTTPNATGTPKHLRFSMPGGTTGMEEEEEDVESVEGSEELEESEVDMSEEPMPSSVREVSVYSNDKIFCS